MPHDPPDPSWTSAPNCMDTRGTIPEDSRRTTWPFALTVVGYLWHICQHQSGTSRPALCKPAPLEFRPAHSAYAALHHPNTEDCAKRKIVSPHSLTFYRAIINTRRPLSQKAGAVINKNIHLRPNPGSMDIHGMERDWELGRPWHCPSDATQSRSTAIPALYCISVQGHSVCASSCACVWNGAKSEVTRRWGCLSDWIPNTFMCFT